MLPSMATSVLASALRHARDSWLGQLGVLALGAVVFTVVSAATGMGGLGGQALGGMVATVLLLASAVRAADLQEDELSIERLLGELAELAGLAPRLLAQVGLSAGPVLVVGFLVLELAGALPLVGLLLMPVAFAVAVASAPVALLSIVGVTRGDLHWWPMYGWHALRTQPGRMLLTTLVGAVVTAMAAVPVVLMGFVVTATAGPLGMLGLGLASASIGPLAGCWALALWEHVGYDGATTARAEPAAPAGIQAHAAAAFAAPEAPWLDGPSWDVAVEPGAVWGTWIRIETAADVAFRLAWTGSVSPQLALGAEDGTWRMPGVASSSGDVIPASLPAGDTYVQVACGDDAAQAIAITMLVRGIAAA